MLGFEVVAGFSSVSAGSIDQQAALVLLYCDRSNHRPSFVMVEHAFVELI